MKLVNGNSSGEHKMGVDIYTNDEGKDWESFILVCNTSDTPFGIKLYGSREEAEAFLQWLPKDSRMYEDDEYFDLFEVFKKHFHNQKVEK